MKKLKYDNIPERTDGFGSNIKELFASLIPYAKETEVYQSVLATSHYFRDLMAAGFEIHQDDVQVLGYPRNDVLFDDTQRTEFIDRLLSLEHENILAYLPTFQETQVDDEHAGLFRGYAYDHEAMEMFLEESNSLLLIKLHFADQLKTANQSFGLGSRIIYADETEVGDISDILRYIDILITDYSGVYFDYLLLNRPVIFAPFDLAEYVNARGLNEDYAFYVSGPVANNWPEVIQSAKDLIQNPKAHEKLRIEKNNFFNAYHDGESASRVYEHLRSKVMTD